MCASGRKRETASNSGLLQLQLPRCQEHEACDACGMQHLQNGPRVGVSQRMHSWRAILLLFLPIKATKGMGSCTCGGAGCWLMIGDSSTAWASSAESQNLASCSSWPLFETKSSSPSHSSKAAASLCHEHLRRITVWSHRVTGDLPPRIKVLSATLKKNHIYPL